MKDDGIGIDPARCTDQFELFAQTPSERPDAGGGLGSVSPGPSDPRSSPFDYVVAILLGATMSRAIVGASPALPTFVASLVIVLMHRALAWACVRSQALEVLVGGVERQLFHDGSFDRQQMLAALVSRT